MQPNAVQSAGYLVIRQTEPYRRERVVRLAAIDQDWILGLSYQFLLQRLIFLSILLTGDIDIDRTYLEISRKIK